jgi:hypothetical protein
MERLPGRFQFFHLSDDGNIQLILNLLLFAVNVPKVVPHKLEQTLEVQQSDLFLQPLPQMRFFLSIQFFLPVVSGLLRIDIPSLIFLHR